jgi:hypothetical protein
MANRINRNGSARKPRLFGDAYNAAEGGITRVKQLSGHKYKLVGTLKTADARELDALIEAQTGESIKVASPAFLNTDGDKCAGVKPFAPLVLAEMRRDNREAIKLLTDSNGEPAGEPAGEPVVN